MTINRYKSYKRRQKFLVAFSIISNPRSLQIFFSITFLLLVVGFASLYIISSVVNFYQKIDEIDSEDVKMEKYQDNADDTPSITIPYVDISEIDSFKKIIQYRIKAGENLGSALTSVNIESDEVARIIDAIDKVYNTKNLGEGKKIHIGYSIVFEDREATSDGKKMIKKKNVVDQVKFDIADNYSIILIRNADGNYVAEKKQKEFIKYIVKYHGKIGTSLFADASSVGVPVDIIGEMIKYYSYDIDFERDVNKGDSFEVLFESYYTHDGIMVKNGKILFTSMNLSKVNKNLSFYYFKHGNEDGFFDENGNSIRKSLLKTPINVVRITSNFGVRRHPILGYTRMHKGVDFGASMGTPVFAAGSGMVVFAGRHGGHGKYVKIRHNGEYSTAYAHLSNYGKGISEGVKVKQGQIIGYVGSTGASTGPHLHYEVIYKGEYINPSMMKSTSQIKLLGKDMTRFRMEKDKVDQYRKMAINSSVN